MVTNVLSHCLSQLCIQTSIQKEGSDSVEETELAICIRDDQAFCIVYTDTCFFHGTYLGQM